MLHKFQFQYDFYCTFVCFIQNVEFSLHVCETNIKLNCITHTCIYRVRKKKSSFDKLFWGFVIINFFWKSSAQITAFVILFLHYEREVTYIRVDQYYINCFVEMKECFFVDLCRFGGSKHRTQMLFACKVILRLH